MRSRKRRNPRSSLVSGTIIAVAAAYAIACVGSGLDRASVKNPDLAAIVPSIFADVAYSTLARDALIRQQGAVALEESAKALAKSPLSSSNLNLLGTASLLANRPDMADKAFTLGARLGRRQPATQAYMITKAINQGDYDAAGARLDAVLRQDPSLTRDPMLMLPFEGNLYAQDAFLRLLARRPPWLGTYVSDIFALQPEQLGVRASMLAELADHGTRLGCNAVDAIVFELNRRQSPDDAHVLWQAHCPGDPGNLLWDGQLAQLNNDPSAVSDFRWKLMPSGDLVVDQRLAAKGKVLEVTNRGEFPQSFLHQLTVLAPGRYWLSWQARNSDGKPSTVIAPKLSCGDVGHATSNPSGFSTVSVTISQECTATWVEFTAAPSSQVTTFGAVRITADAAESRNLKQP